MKLFREVFAVGGQACKSSGGGGGGGDLKKLPTARRGNTKATAPQTLKKLPSAKRGNTK